MKLDLEAELANISEQLEKAQKKADYYNDEVKRLTGAKDFGLHLLRVAQANDVVDDEDVMDAAVAVAQSPSGANGTRR